MYFSVKESDEIIKRYEALPEKVKDTLMMENTSKELIKILYDYFCVLFDADDWCDATEHYRHFNFIYNNKNADSEMRDSILKIIKNCEGDAFQCVIALQKNLNKDFAKALMDNKSKSYLVLLCLAANDEFCFYNYNKEFDDFFEKILADDQDSIQLNILKKYRWDRGFSAIVDDLISKNLTKYVDYRGYRDSSMIRTGDIRNILSFLSNVLGVRYRLRKKPSTGFFRRFFS